ncbi:MAG: DUF3578 domain-containing protein, partial [Kitasatospora sp.]|nr:DUF3578 domain-containing protein [Kitasatospora sp.]
MTIRGFLHEVGATYNRLAGTQSQAAQLLRKAPSYFEQHSQSYYKVKGSPGNGNAAFCPWVAFFDPDETDTARHGMYVVYLFAENMSTVSLSLNQGVTDLQERHGAKEANLMLAR